MSIVTMNIHKHQCAICERLFLRIEQTGEASCLCSNWVDSVDANRIEFCEKCGAQLTEAGWLGSVLRGLVERVTVLTRAEEARMEKAASL